MQLELPASAERFSISYPDSEKLE